MTAPVHEHLRGLVGLLDAAWAQMADRLAEAGDTVDDTHRRTVNTQTTVQESRHRLARKIFHGKRGALYQKYREDVNELGRYRFPVLAPDAGLRLLQDPQRTVGAAAAA